MIFGAALYQIIWRARGRSMSWDTFRLSAAGGIGFGLQAVLLYTALQRTSVVSASVILSLQPILLIPLSRRLFGESVGVVRLWLTALAVAGTAVVVLGSSAGGRWTLGGDVLAFVATIMGCLYFVGTKAAREHLDPLEFQAAALVWGALFAAPVAAVLSGGMSYPRADELVWPIAMTAIAGSGHLLMNAAQRHLTVGATSTLALVVTPLTALGAAVIYGESLGWQQVLGMAIVLGSLGAFATKVPLGSPRVSEGAAE